MALTFERFNKTYAWRVRDTEKSIDWLGSYNTLVGCVMQRDNGFVILYPKNVGYSPTTSKNVTQMLRQWYKYDMPAGFRREVCKTNEPTGEVFETTGYQSTTGDWLYRVCKVQYDTTFGELAMAYEELKSVYGRNIKVYNGIQVCSEHAFDWWS